MATSYQQIHGTIKWDEGNRGTLPLIVTDERQWQWLDLGKGLMTREGFGIEIEIT